MVRPAKRAFGLNFDLIVLDHGLYKELPTDFRLDYANLWLAMINGTEDDIQKYATRLGGLLHCHCMIVGGHAHRLFTSMLTARSWNAVSSDLKTERTTQEMSEIMEKTPQFAAGIVDLLAKIPRPLLLVLKTNDLLRAINMTLNGSELESIQLTLKYASKVVWDAERIKQSSWTGRVLLMARKVHYWFLQRVLSVWATLRRLSPMHLFD
jgi:aarF domain-containing kinase